MENDAAPAQIAAVVPIPSEVATPKMKRPVRTFGQDAEAALRERHAKASGTDLIYMFRGVEYRLQPLMPAAFILHAGRIQHGEEVNMDEFMFALKSAFMDEDADKFEAAMMDLTSDIPADAEFMSDVMTAISEAVSGRPSTN